MPIPNRFFSDIAMDFITTLPPSQTSFGKEQATNILVITHRPIKNILTQSNDDSQQLRSIEQPV
ncbi:hypothetical protein GcM1_215049, partial [Golovinomyces cichoracearum]